MRDGQRVHIGYLVIRREGNVLSGSPLEEVPPPVWDSQREQRLHRRYPIALEAQYKLLGRGGQVTHSGGARTVNISAGGALLKCNERLPSGCTIEVSIQWPYLLDGIRSMKLFIRGRIIRTADPLVGIQIVQHEFRVAARRPRS